MSNTIVRDTKLLIFINFTPETRALTQSGSHGPPYLLRHVQDVGSGLHALIARLLQALGVDGRGYGGKKILHL